MVFCTEPVYIQLEPQSARSQYILHWYVAETLPQALEAEMDIAEEASGRPTEQSRTNRSLRAESDVTAHKPYSIPPRYPPGLTLKERAAMEETGWEPKRHKGTGVNEEEATYESYLVPVEEAIARLKGVSWVMADVVSRGWTAICTRMNMERTSR